MATKKKWWWIIGVAVFIVGLLIAGWHYFKKDLANPQSKIVKPLIKEQLKKFLNKASDGLYQMKYDRFDLNIDSGKGLITHLKLIADTATYNLLLKQKKAPNNVLTVEIDSLIIKDFGFTKTDSGRRFHIAAVIIKNPRIVMSNKRQPYNDTAKHNSGLIKGLLKDLLNISSVRHVTLSNMTFIYINKNEKSLKRTVFERWNVGMSDIALANLADPGDAKKQKKPGAISVGRFTIATPDSLYRLIFTDMRLLPQQRNMYLKRFVLQPRLNKVDFYKRSGFNRDRLHFIYNRLSMKNIDIDRLIRRQQLHVGSMNVGNSWTEVFNNYHWPQRVRPVRKYVYPHQRLQLLAFDITIDTMKMHNGFFRYAIAARRSARTASLFMTNIESRFYHVTNNTLEKKKNPYLIAKSTNRMMGAADSYVKYVFNLASKNGAFNAFIHMGRMDATAVNPLGAPLGLMAVRSGTINKMNMRIYANRYTAKGNIDIYYNNLKIDILKRDKKADTLKKRGFLSFLTNVVMPNDNPKKNGKFRRGPINVIHDPRMSFFGLLWKCTQDGMSSAMMGVDQHKDKPDENVVIKVIKKVFKPLQKKKHLKKDADQPDNENN